MFKQVNGTDVHLNEMEEVWICGRLNEMEELWLAL